MSDEKKTDWSELAATLSGIGLELLLLGIPQTILKRLTGRNFGSPTLGYIIRPMQMRNLGPTITSQEEDVRA